MVETVDEDQLLPAGSFSTWLAGMERALRGDGTSDVPCDGCTACCTSSQFIDIGADESDALERIPSDLLFPAPGLPRGNVVLGYDERGHCPMLIDGKCSIYEHRPRTCRTYDCRVFPAAGVDLHGEPEKLAIAQRARRWRFDFPAEVDGVLHEAVRAAARHVQEREDLCPSGAASARATQRAVLASRLHPGRTHDGEAT
jgi:Fe-S-cluster containining protein